MKSAIRYLVSAAFLIYFVWNFAPHLSSAAQALRHANWAIVTAGLGLFCVSLVIMGLRLKVILDSQKVRLGAWDSVTAAYVGVFFNNFLPTSVGGDIVKAYCVARKSGEPAKALGCVLMDRIAGLIAFIAVPVITVFGVGGKVAPHISKTLNLLCVLALLGCVILLTQNLIRSALIKTGVWNRWKFIAAFWKYIDLFHRVMVNPRVMIQILGISFAIQFFGVFSVFLIFKGLGCPIGVTHILLTLPIIQLFALFPSINGLGLRESGFVYFYSASVGEAAASSIAIINLAYLIFASFVGMLLYFNRKDFHFEWSGMKEAIRGWTGS